MNLQSMFNKIKVGSIKLEDAVLDLGELKRAIPEHPFINKRTIFRAIAEKDYETLRAISEFFYNISGIYKRICLYFAYMYRYDWLIVPERFDDAAEVKSKDTQTLSAVDKKVLKDFTKALRFLDNSEIKKVCGDIALEVIKYGCYYGYIVPNKDGLMLQQLPAKYCRVRYWSKGMPAVEFNMKFFDNFTDVVYRLKVLDLFPEEFKKGYMLYKQGKLALDHYSDTYGWYLLDVNSVIKFNLNGSDIPFFVNSIPTIIDLDAAQDLDRRKQMQKLLKIIIQKLPLDKNNDLVFDIDEAKDIHKNTVEMLADAIGVDVITTFADMDSIDLSDKNTTATQDDLNKVERTVYNSLGSSHNLFNTDSNLSLQKSIQNDESSVRDLILQFQAFFNRVTRIFSSNRNKYDFRFYMLETTQDNYKELSKLYKEQVQLGYSQLLPQIALGHSQSFILNTAHFENEVLKLQEIMIPPLMSSTMSSANLGSSNKSNGNNSNNNQNSSGNKTTTQTTVRKTSVTEEKSAGRPETPDDQKSEKTIANKESM